MSGKEEIREKLKIKRRYFYGVRREVADGCIKDNFLAAFSSCDSFFIYNSFSTEADTSAIINALVSAGKKVFLPRTEGENIVAAAVFFVLFCPIALPSYKCPVFVFMSCM